MRTREAGRGGEESEEDGPQGRLHAQRTDFLSEALGRWQENGHVPLLCHSSVMATSWTAWKWPEKWVTGWTKQKSPFSQTHRRESKSKPRSISRKDFLEDQIWSCQKGYYQWTKRLMSQPRLFKEHQQQKLLEGYTTVKFRRTLWSLAIG